MRILLGLLHHRSPRGTQCHQNRNNPVIFGISFGWLLQKRKQRMQRRTYGLRLLLGEIKRNPHWGIIPLHRPWRKVQEIHFRLQRRRIRRRSCQPTKSIGSRPQHPTCLSRHQRRSYLIPILQEWSAGFRLWNPIGPRSVGSRIRKRKRKRLLARQEFLGNWMGRRRVYQNEKRQQLWCWNVRNPASCQLSYFSLMILLSELNAHIISIFYSVLLF